GASIFDLFGDIFGGLFTERGHNGAQGGEDLVYSLDLTLAEAYRGCTKTITYPREEACRDCRGSGAKPGSQPARCRNCRGRGVVWRGRGFSRVQQTGGGCGGRGWIVTEICAPCKGRGRVKGKQTLQVEIPAGVDNGTRQLSPLRGEGNAGEPGGPPG